MTTEGKATKSRPIWMRKSSYKYLLELLHGIRRELRDIRNTQRIIAMGMEHYFVFDKDYISSIACSDEVDQRSSRCLKPVLPAASCRETSRVKIQYYEVTPWQVTLRIRRMNKRLDKQIGQKVAEKRGLRWSPTDFTEASLELGEKEF